MSEEEQVRHLLEEAGPRPEVPPEDMARIKAAFRAEWQEHVRQRRSPDRRLWLLAASVLLMIGLGWWLWPASSGPVARVETSGETIIAGAKLEAHEAPAAVRLEGGPSLRLDAGSLVRLISASEVRLERGAVYLDSQGTGTVAVHTPLGTVTELGTQFEVRLLGSAVRVRVREGAVGVASHRVEAGTELTLQADGSVTRSHIASYGPPWNWVLKAAPPVPIEGMTLEEVLKRVVRETGWTVRYEDPRVAASAGEIVVHGDVGHLAPDQALEVVLPGAGLDHRVVDGVLILKAPN
ncbi:MAG TPA: FecR family protein [Thermoanaerobaculia bacterium]|nr:FecR family protein [Thermoanaerobaculia bacterium]